MNRTLDLFLVFLWTIYHIGSTFICILHSLTGLIVFHAALTGISIGLAVIEKDKL